MELRKTVDGLRGLFPGSGAKPGNAASQADAEAALSESPTQKKIPKNHSASSQLNSTNDLLRKPTFLEKILRTGPSSSHLIDHLIQHEPGSVSLNETRAAMAKHNKSFLANPRRAGLARLHANGEPLSIPMVDLHGRQDNQNLFYTIDGKLDARPLGKTKSIAIRELPEHHFNQKVSTLARAKIKRLHRKIEGENTYSTMAVPLAVCRTVRLRRTQDQAIEFGDVVPDFFVRGGTLLREYRGGTCFSLAEEMVAGIREKTGLKAFVVNQKAPSNILTLWPSASSFSEVPNQEVLRLLGEDTHTNVVVPYMQDGFKRYIRIDMGTGPQGIIRDISHDDYSGWGKELVIENPGKLAGLTAQCLCKLHIRDHNSSFVFGIDLLRGTMYLNATAKQSLSKDPEEASISTASFEGDEAQAVISRQSAKLFLSMVAEHFSFSSEFVEDAMFLLLNRHQWIESVLIHPAVALSACIEERDKVLRMLVAHESVISGKIADQEIENLLHLARESIQDAAKLVETGNGVAAKEAYTKYWELFVQVSDLSLGLLRVPELKILRVLQHVDAEIFVKLFKDNLREICVGIDRASQEYPEAANTALKNLGKDVLQNFGQGCKSIQRALQELNASKASAKELF